MPTIIRVASEDDSEGLTLLRQAFWDNQRNQGLLDIPRDGMLSIDATHKLIKRPRAVIMVAGDTRLSGFCIGSLQIAPQFAGSKVAIVEEVYVSPDAGQRGVGSDLVEKTFDHLLGDGGGRRQARVLPANEVALDFWAKRGFKPTLLTLERE